VPRAGGWSGCRRARSAAGAEPPLRILLEGRPGVGKSTVARRLAERLLESGVPVTGFVTDELRESGRRVGFAVETLDGRRAVLARVGLRSPVRVSKYGVDLEAFERVALRTVRPKSKRTLVLIDELGKMELASERFRAAVTELFETTRPVVATVHVARDPFTDALKRRRDVETVRVSTRNRDELPDQLAERLSTAA
jgi:nucleoside-triphosphatase